MGQCWYSCVFFFFFNDTATTEIYTLSLHDALPICQIQSASEYEEMKEFAATAAQQLAALPSTADRKSTRLNSSHLVISYAVFCLKKKKRHLGPDVAAFMITMLNMIASSETHMMEID